MNNNTQHCCNYCFRLLRQGQVASILIMSWTRLLSASERVEHAVSLKTVPARFPELHSDGKDVVGTTNIATHGVSYPRWKKEVEVIRERILDINPQSPCSLCGQLP